MEMSTWLMLGGAFLIGAAVTGGAARWWFTRKLREGVAVQERLEKARQFTAGQASQARKQIEVLQQDMALLRMAHAKGGQRSAPTPTTGLVDEKSGDGLLDDAGPPKLPVDGFPDTQVLMPPRP